MPRVLSLLTCLSHFPLPSELFLPLPQKTVSSSVMSFMLRWHLLLTFWHTLFAAKPSFDCWMPFVSISFALASLAGLACSPHLAFDCFPLFPGVLLCFFLPPMVVSSCCCGTLVM